LPTGGVCVRRRPTRKEVQGSWAPTPSAIPAMKETVIHHGNREAKGFGGSSVRFAEATDPDEPGPGHVEVPGAFANEVGSIGQRGSGSFASKCKKGDTSYPEMRRFPGPGHYADALDLPLGDAQQKPHAAFARATSWNPHKLYERPMPGPGHYEPQEPRARGPLKAAGPLLSIPKASRVQEPSKKVAAGQPRLGPGEYDGWSAENIVKPTAPSVPSWRSSKMNGRRLRPSAEAFQDLPEHKQKEVLAATFQPELVDVEGPGPGYYFTEKPMAEETTGGTGTWAFQEGTSHLPRTRRDPSPAPGQYSIELPPGSQGSPSKAAFASKMGRMAAPRPNAPGPAYYTPRDVHSPRSFNLNSARSWMR